MSSAEELISKGANIGCGVKYGLKNDWG